MCITGTPLFSLGTRTVYTHIHTQHLAHRLPFYNRYSQMSSCSCTNVLSICIMVLAVVVVILVGVFLAQYRWTSDSAERFSIGYSELSELSELSTGSTYRAINEASVQEETNILNRLATHSQEQHRTDNPCEDGSSVTLNKVHPYTKKDECQTLENTVGAFLLNKSTRQTFQECLHKVLPTADKIQCDHQKDMDKSGLSPNTNVLHERAANGQ